MLYIVVEMEKQKGRKRPWICIKCNKREIERKREIVFGYYTRVTYYLISIVKIKREIEREKERKKERERRERERKI